MREFCLDGDDVRFPAIAWGRRWNGWECPIVASSTLAAVVARLNEREQQAASRPEARWELHFAPDGEAVIYEYTLLSSERNPSGEFHIAPDCDGGYELNMGLTLCRAGE